MKPRGGSTLAAALSLLGVVTAQEDTLSACPTCYTSTVTIAPPCVPWFTCTGEITPPPDGCTSTVDNRPTTVTIVIPGSNPACPTTPRTTFQLNCPTQPACYESLCTTLMIGTLGGGGWGRTTITEPPLDCMATTTYTIPPTTPLPIDSTAIPPPFPSFPPDEDFP